MPPKGWRKNAEGQYPAPTKDTELVSIDDILFPRSTIQKLAKAILNDEESGNSSMIIAKDSLLAIQRSATVFVSHILFHASRASHKGSRKTVNAQDIFQALEDAEFSGFLPEVKQHLSVYENAQSLKKKQTRAPETGPREDTESGAEDGDEGVEIEQGDDVVEDAEVDEGDEVTVNPIAASEREQAELAGAEEQVEEKEEASDTDDE